MYQKHLLFLLVILLLLAACENDENNAPVNTPITIVPASTRFVQNLSEVPPTIAFLPTQTPITYDPGPYFTPERPAPAIRAVDFEPPASVGDFTRIRSNGRCTSSEGQVSEYQADDGRVFLDCLYNSNPTVNRNQIEQLIQTYGGDVIVGKVQGNHSFVLVRTAAQSIYAWTHSGWLFAARTNGEQRILEQFMQNFPH
jgi:hypothetical protein